MPESGLVRIPEWILNELPTLDRCRFSPILARFSRKYRRLIESRTRGDERQDALLKETLQSLLGSDQRFAGTYNPLALLNFFEKAQSAGRDHYFHTFTNFLLGCLIIDRCHTFFEEFQATCFPSAKEWSTEYVWLLTVLFHDVGQPVQKLDQIHEMVFGVSPPSTDQGVAQRGEAWNSSLYRVARAQIVSLYEHLKGFLVEDALQFHYPKDLTATHRHDPPSPFPAPRRKGNSGSPLPHRESDSR